MGTASRVHRASKIGAKKKVLDTPILRDLAKQLAASERKCAVTMEKIAASKLLLQIEASRRRAQDLAVQLAASDQQRVNLLDSPIRLAPMGDGDDALRRQLAALKGMGSVATVQYTYIRGSRTRDDL